MRVLHFRIECQLLRVLKSLCKNAQFNLETLQAPYEYNEESSYMYSNAEIPNCVCYL
jgi:hypothetical protein